MKKLSFFLIFLLGMLNSYAQFERNYGDESADRFFVTGCKTLDGGYCMLGSSDNSQDGSDVLLVKLDAQGQTVWTKTWHNYGLDQGLKVFAMTNGNYLVIANGYESSVNHHKLYAAILDGQGNVTNPMLTSVYWEMKDAISTADGGFLLVAYDELAALTKLIKLDATGAILGTYNSLNAYPLSIYERNNGNFLLGVKTPTFVNEIVEVSPTGASIANHPVGSEPIQILEYAGAIYICTPNNYALIKYDSNYNELWFANASSLVMATNSGNLLTTFINDITEIDTATGSTILWQNTSTNTYATYSSVILKDANTYIGMGSTSETGNNMALVTSFDITTTNENWRATNGTPSNAANEYGNTVEPTPDGGFLLAGSGSVGIAKDGKAAVVKTDFLSNVQWITNIGADTNNLVIWGTCIANNQTDYVVMGYARNQGLIYCSKLNSQGIPLWEKTYLASSFSIFGNIQAYPSGGYVVAATVSGGFSVLIKMNENGDTLWTKKYKYASTSTTQALDLIVANNGDIILAGRCRVNSRYSQWLMRADAQGNLLWQKAFPANANITHRFTSIVEDAATGDLYGYGYLLNSTTSPITENGRLMKLNAMGDSLNQFTLQGTPTLSRWGYRARLAANNEILLVGMHSSKNFDDAANTFADREVSLTKLDNNFNIIWDKTFAEYQVPILYDGHVLSNGGYVAAGSIKVKAHYNMYLLQTAANGTVSVETPIRLPFQVTMYPNPISQQTISISIKAEEPSSFQCSIYDIQGKIIETKTLTENTTLLDVSYLPAGAYFIKIEDDKHHAMVEKVIKE
ncbi:MAG: T9SS type A sorting domain-containing protein [Bacteroidia bacterium]